MSGMRDLLIRGSKKIIEHYRVLLVGKSPSAPRFDFPSEGGCCSMACRLEAIG